MAAMAAPLKQLRRQAGYSLRQLAEATGHPYETIWRIETGRQRARPSTAKRLADALGVRVAAVAEFANGGTEQSGHDHRPD